MPNLLKTTIAVCPLAVGAGLLMGNATVDGMRIRGGADAPAGDSAAADASYARGEQWARDHYPLDPDRCPHRDVDYLRGCIAASAY